VVKVSDFLQLPGTEGVVLEVTNTSQITALPNARWSRQHLRRWLCRGLFWLVGTLVQSGGSVQPAPRLRFSVRPRFVGNEGGLS
jgi:hypothetical protein